MGISRGANKIIFPIFSQNLCKYEEIIVKPVRFEIMASGAESWKISNRIGFCIRIESDPDT